MSSLIGKRLNHSALPWDGTRPDDPSDRRVTLLAAGDNNDAGLDLILRVHAEKDPVSGLTFFVFQDPEGTRLSLVPLSVNTFAVARLGDP